AGTDTAAQLQLHGTFVEIANDTSLPDGLLAVIADRYIDGLLAAKRVSQDPDADAQAVDQQAADWSAETRAALRATYGAKNGEQLLERAQKFVRAHPALAKVLQQRGLGSRPDVVAGIAAHVHSTGYR